jgi:hypothetical protein
MGRPAGTNPPALCAHREVALVDPSPRNTHYCAYANRLQLGERDAPGSRFLTSLRASASLATNPIFG